MRSRLARNALALALLALAACAPRGELSFAAPPPGAALHEIMVATSRASAPPPLFFGSGRGNAPGFGAFTVSVPPTHAPGTIAWPDADPDPRIDFVLSQAVVTRSAEVFDAGLRRRFRATQAPAEAVIFVHGYNTNYAEALYRFAQMVHDFDTSGVPVLYSWPSAGSASNYLYDRDSVLFARDGLEDLIDRVRAAGADRILLVAHSVGAQLLVETLRQKALRAGGLWSGLSGVVLISPDIDLDLFRAQSRAIGLLPQPFVIITSRRDRALQLSQWLSGSSGRLGAVDNLSALSELQVTVIDTTGASPPGAVNHISAVTSPALISILGGLERNRSFALDRPTDLGAVLPLRVVSEGVAVGLIIGAP